MKLHTPIDILLNVLLPLIVGLFLYSLGEALPALFRNHLADGLWAYAFLSLVLIIWHRKVPVAWTAVCFISAITFEWLQSSGIVPGTADIMDVLIYFLFFILALVLNAHFKSPATT